MSLPTTEPAKRIGALFGRRPTTASKPCLRCSAITPLDQFCKNKLRKDGLAYYCKPCREVFKRRSESKRPTHYREVVEKWHKDNPERVRQLKQKWSDRNPEKRAAAHRRRRYNITQAQYDQMLQDQSERCAICGIKPDYKPRQKGEKRLLHVDHCHKTGRVRGLLCWKCNMGLGSLNDDPRILALAIEYLSK